MAPFFSTPAGVGRGIPGQLPGGLLGCREQPYMQSQYCKELGDYRNEWVDVNNTHALKHRCVVIPCPCVCCCFFPLC